MKRFFMLSILFKSHLIRHSVMGYVFKDTHRALENLRHSESTRRALRGLLGTRTLGGHSNIWRALEHSGTWVLKALGHSDTQGTQALGHLRHPGTWALRHLEGTRTFGRHSSTRVLKALRHSDT